MTAPLKPLRWYRELGERQGRLAAGAFPVEGERAIRQVVGLHPESVTEIISVTEPPSAYNRYPRRLVTESQFRYICHTRTPQGIMAVVRAPADISTDTLPAAIGRKALLLEDIQDPGNVGTLIRTAAAFDFSGVVLTESCADPLSPKCVQATAGTVLSVWLRRTSKYLELAGELKDAGFTLVAADLAGGDGPSVLEGRSKVLLALGSEGAGLSEKLLSLADYRLYLPTAREKAESLNVAACGAILMYLVSQAQQ